MRDGHSTVALLAGCKGKVVSYDVVRSPIVDVLGGMELPCEWEFVRASTSDPSVEIVETDMLFVDTLHTFEQVEKELGLHGRKAMKYLAFHDTETCLVKDVSGPDPNAEGIGMAIAEFLFRWKGCYELAYATAACNGLRVYSRTDTPLPC